ncbi:hypothetical protein BOX15_Mlig028140g2, partial [Macrostomum lignano]
KASLLLKAQLEGVTSLRPVGDDFRWYIRLRCLNCGDETPELVYVCLDEEHEIHGSRGTAHLVIKCKLCHRENTLSILPDSIASYDLDDSNKFKSIVVFDCRGVEPTEWSPRIGWACAGAETGTQFPEVNLTELDWSDFDEKAKASVGVYEVEYKFTHTK